MVELKQAKAYIIKYKRKPILRMVDLAFLEIDEEEDLGDLIGRQLKGKVKEVDKNRKRRSVRKKKH